MKIDEKRELDISDHNKCEVVMMGELGGVKEDWSLGKEKRGRGGRHTICTTR